jgi:predicted phosphoribosyltransferase
VIGLSSTYINQPGGAPITTQIPYPQYHIFRDRADAGRQLAMSLRDEFSGEDCIVLALPRGGVPVAYEIASVLKLPLDVLVVRKLGAPFHRELAVGAIGPGGVVAYNDRIMAQLGLDRDSMKAIRNAEQLELERRERVYRGGRSSSLDVAGKIVIVVDDGIATGSTMLVAVKALRRLGPRSIVVAVPTSSKEALLQLQQLADKVIALITPEPYIAVGAWYERFDQTSDEDVTRLLSSETL